MNLNVKHVFKRLERDERGITALETAIILIAFVVVASVFAFTILSAGTFSTERGKEAIYAGLSSVQSSMEIKGSVIASAAVTNTGPITEVVFTVSNAVGGEPINLGDEGSSSNRVVVIDYRDATQIVPITDWTLAWLGNNDDGDGLLEPGELAEITVPLTDLNPSLGVNTDFTIEIKPPTGAVLNIQRTTPAFLELVNDLQ